MSTPSPYYRHIISKYSNKIHTQRMFEYHLYLCHSLPNNGGFYFFFFLRGYTKDILLFMCTTNALQME